MILKVFILFLIYICVGCNAGKDKPAVELLPGMVDQVSLKAQDWDAKTGQGASLLPPEGTLSREQEFYPYKNHIVAEKTLKNPFKNNFSPEFLLKGQGQYRIYCAVCHGQEGRGDGAVAPKMVIRPPDLMSKNIRNFSDARLFHVITRGKGLMGSYESQITEPRMRWAIVNYLRTLQNRYSKNNK